MRTITDKTPRLSTLSIVPKRWPGETIVCIASGPSLTQADVDLVRGAARIIAVKDSVRMAPDADVLYACDMKWWRAHKETQAFAGLKYGLERAPDRLDVAVLRNTGQTGLELSPTGLRTGQNSGYQAINLAVHLGAKRILLLGYDMQANAHGRHHWFGAHSYSQVPPPYARFLPMFPTLIGPLARLGIRIVNCTRGGALQCFPRMPLEQALAIVAPQLQVSA